MKNGFIGAEPVMWLTLGAIAILTTFLIFGPFGKILLGDPGEEKEMKDNFKILEKAIDDLLAKGDNAETRVPMVIGSSAILVGYDADWSDEGEGSVDECGWPDDYAYQPVECFGKACLVLYADDVFDNEQGTNSKHLGIKVFDENIEFYVATQDPMNYGRNKVYESNYEYLLLYGNCGTDFGGERFRKGTVYTIKKFPFQGKTAIHFQPIQ